jgi:cytochrome c oxidase subunit 2
MNSTPGTETSNFVSSYDKAFYFIAGISLILLICLTVTMVYFIFRYNRKKNKVATQIEGNLFLEVLWTVIPVLLSLAMFFLGWQGWKPMNKPPKDGMTVTSVARMWNFLFIYENGKQSPNLIVPVNSPVKIKLVSMDVIHSLFIPDFRVKSDMIPGREKNTDLLILMVPAGRGRRSVLFILLSIPTSCTWFRTEAETASNRIPRLIIIIPGVK